MWSAQLSGSRDSSLCHNNDAVRQSSLRHVVVVVVVGALFAGANIAWRPGRPSSSKLHDLLSTVATCLLMNLSNPWYHHITSRPSRSTATTSAFYHFWNDALLQVFVLLYHDVSEKNLSFLAVKELHNFLPQLFLPKCLRFVFWLSTTQIVITTLKCFFTRECYAKRILATAVATVCLSVCL